MSILHNRICPIAISLATLIMISTSVFASQNGPALSSKDKADSLETVTVYAAGDIADCQKNLPADTMAEKTSELILAGLAVDSKAVALTLGDNTYPVGKPEEFSNCYAPTWGKFKNRTLPSPGNHDYGVPSAHGYYNYFGEIAGPDQRGYYSRKVGQWLLISLNSNIDGKQMHEQLRWLKKELNTHQHSCTLAFWHHPVFSSGWHGNYEVMQEAWKILSEAKADLVLTAHDHHYERFSPLDVNGVVEQKSGIRSFVVGTGGAKLRPTVFTVAGSELRENSTYGVLKLSLHEKSYNWEFLPIEGQTFTDKGHGECH